MNSFIHFGCWNNLNEKIKNENDAKSMVMEDLTTVCNALGTLIKMGDDSNFFDGKVVAEMCVNYLKENFLQED